MSNNNNDPNQPAVPLHNDELISPVTAVSPVQFGQFDGTNGGVINSQQSPMQLTPPIPSAFNFAGFDQHQHVQDFVGAGTGMPQPTMQDQNVRAEGNLLINQPSPREQSNRVDIYSGATPTPCMGHPSPYTPILMPEFMAHSSSPIHSSYSQSTVPSSSFPSPSNPSMGPNSMTKPKLVLPRELLHQLAQNIPYKQLERLVLECTINSFPIYSYLCVLYRKLRSMYQPFTQHQLAYIELHHVMTTEGHVELAKELDQKVTEFRVQHEMHKSQQEMLTRQQEMLTRQQEMLEQQVVETLDYFMLKKQQLQSENAGKVVDGQEAGTSAAAGKQHKE